jgi:hypothetical protein
MVAAAASHVEPGVYQTSEAGCPVNIRAPGYILQRPGHGGPDDRHIPTAMLGDGDEQPCGLRRPRRDGLRRSHQ